MPKNEGPKPGGSTGGGGSTPYRPNNRIQEVTRGTTGSEQAERARFERATPATPKDGRKQ